MEADGTNYPRAVIPILPSVSCKINAAIAGSAFLDGAESFVQGRYALSEALRRAGVVPGSAVLLPAFHCRSMVEPVLYLGAQPRFYKVTADLRPDFTSLSELVSETPVAAMVLTHYFGFPNALDEAVKFCAIHAITLIEDCAHAFYGRFNGRLPGTLGQYAIASPWKFLPVRDGGLLRDNTGGLAAPRHEQHWLAEIKSWVALLQIRRQQARTVLPVIDVDALCEQAKRIAERQYKPSLEAGMKEFVPERAGFSALRSSRWLTTHAQHGCVMQKRRDNYLQWLEGVSMLPGVQPLYPCLPEGVVPYVFPLLIDTAGMGFHLLKLAGIPILRWEEMAVTDCDVASSYRVRLLQLPCHQSLHAEEMAWLIRTVKVLSSRIDSLRSAG